MNEKVLDNLVEHAVFKVNIDKFKGPPCFGLNGQSKCLNSGICIPRLNDFVCKCPLQFSGQRCENLTKGDSQLKSFLFDGKTHFSYMSKINLM